MSGSERELSGSGTPAVIDTTVPHSARLWNYWLGGKDNYEVDRRAGDEVLAVYPQVRDNARACRAFLSRTVRFLAVEAGIRQFLDVGTGLPTADNTHEVAQRAAPEARIVYVDNDPLVLAHARALLTSSPQGRTSYVDADARDPERILTEAARVLDFAEPVGLILLGLLGHLEYEQALATVRALRDRLAPGSHLVVCDAADADPVYNEATRQKRERGEIWYEPRGRAQIAGYFEGFGLVEPGVVFIDEWRPEPPPAWPALHVNEYGGVGRLGPYRSA